MAPRHTPRSLRHEFQQYVEREVEDYKNSVSTVFLHSIANEAARALDEHAQLGMREVLLADEVDRIIARRLRLPSYETWRRRRLKNAKELRRPEHWGLRPDTPLSKAIPPLASMAPVLVAGARVEGSTLFLAANGCEVTAVEPEVAVVNRVLLAARDAGLTEKVRGFVADLVSWTPDGPLAAVICTPAAFAGLSVFERDQVTVPVAQCQTATNAVSPHRRQSCKPLSCMALTTQCNWHLICYVLHLNNRRITRPSLCLWSREGTFNGGLDRAG